MMPWQPAPSPPSCADAGSAGQRPEWSRPCRRSRLRRAADVVTTSADGESRLSIVEPPLLTGAIAWTLFVGRDERRRRGSADSDRSRHHHQTAGCDPKAVDVYNLS